MASSVKITKVETDMPILSLRDDQEIKINRMEVVEMVMLSKRGTRMFFSKDKDGSLAILQGLTGYVQPGEVLAIMGPSGSGKSTLLDTLSGRLESNTRQFGEILINGHKQSLAFGTSAYVTQDDILMKTLTVKETVYYSAMLQLPDSMSKTEKKERTETVIREMGLQNAMNTRIRGREEKGLSGGQKRRVSICIEILTRPNLLFLDEPTNGFDSAASYHVMNKIVGLAKQYGMTVITSIHQPSGEVSIVLEKESQASFITQSLVLTRRSFVNMFRDLGYYWWRLIINIGLGICLGTEFHNIGHSYGSIQARDTVLMFIAGFLTFMAIGGFPSFVEDMKFLSRIHNNYGVAAFVMGNTCSSTPYLLLISLIPAVIAYYLIGFHKGFEQFVYFALVLFSCMLLIESLMMVVASLVPDFLLGIITGAGIQGEMLLNCGFFRLPSDLPKPIWRYPMYYMAFQRYAIEGFYKNEFEGLTFPNNLAGGPPTIRGHEILKNIWQCRWTTQNGMILLFCLGVVFLSARVFHFPPLGIKISYPEFLVTGVRAQEDCDFLQGGILTKSADMDCLEWELLDQDVLGKVHSTLSSSIFLNCLNSYKRVTFNDVVEVFGDESRIIPLGTLLLASGNYSDVEVRGKRASHIENESKREGKIFDSASNLISNDLCDMTCDIRDQPCNVIHGTQDKSWWLSYGVCKRLRLNLFAPLEITSDKSKLSSYDERYHIVDNGDVRIALTNDNSLSSDMMQYASSMARNMSNYQTWVFWLPSAMMFLRS
ncbi:hypothetical protein GIB67_043028 [Kingdonia uniflora]|uniref:ABC transporter domain-containing protein n=1 Tax=Kingdonia uniflora TaxID=39325 RepID=A0A7J7NTV5_9MAGN|nr:hypothetical protein GIB67_043028 [Kingdonia uniflora]